MPARRTPACRRAKFTVQQPASPVIAPGGSTTFQVNFGPTDAGQRTATITIPNDDADEFSYDFVVRGIGGNELIIDNGAPGYSETGLWTTGPNGYFNGTVRLNDAGVGNESATWTFEGLQPGTYDVFSHWPSLCCTASNAPFRFFDDAAFLTLPGRPPWCRCHGPR